MVRLPLVARDEREEQRRARPAARAEPHRHDALEPERADERGERPERQRDVDHAERALVRGSTSRTATRSRAPPRRRAPGRGSPSAGGRARPRHDLVGVRARARTTGTRTAAAGGPTARAGRAAADAGPRRRTRRRRARASAARSPRRRRARHERAEHAGGTSTGCACSRSPIEGCSCRTSGHEPDREQDEADEAQRRRTHDEEQRDPAGADHSAVRQQLSDAHWRGIIWRTPRRTCSPVQYASPLPTRTGEVVGWGPKFAGCVAVALCAVWPATAAATIDAIALRPSGVRGLPLHRLDVDVARPVSARDARWIDPPDAAPADRRRRRRRRLPRLDPHLRAGRGTLPPARCSRPSTAIPAGATHHRDAGRPQRDLRAALRRLLGGHDPSARIAESRGADGRRRRPSAPGTYTGLPRPTARPSPIAGSVHGQRRLRGPDHGDRHARALPHRARGARSPVFGADPLGGTLAATLSRPGGGRSDARRCGRASAATARPAAARARTFDGPAPRAARSPSPGSPAGSRRTT